MNDPGTFHADIVTEQTHGKRNCILHTENNVTFVVKATVLHQRACQTNNGEGSDYKEAKLVPVGMSGVRGFGQRLRTRTGFY